MRNLLVAAALIATAITGAQAQSLHDGGRTPYQGYSAGREDLTYRNFSCTPTKITNETDPVMSVDVGLQTAWGADGLPKQLNWDVSHNTVHGASYRRQEQYTNIRWYMPNLRQPYWTWNGHWDKDWNVVMFGSLEQTNFRDGVFMYKEYTRNLTRPYARPELVTSAVCRETLPAE